MPKKSKHNKLLDDPDVERWFKNCRRGSYTTAKVNLRRLGLFCEQHNLTPKQLVAMGREEHSKLEDLVQDHVTWMEEEEYSPGYIAGILKGIRSWLAHNEIELKRKVKISHRGATPTLQDERVPEKEELKTLLMYGDERASAAICLVAQAGLRLQVLGNAQGNDGLTIRDLPELKVHKDRVEFTRTPTMIRVRFSLSKAGHKYLTFLPQEGCNYLAAYLDKRLAQGEEFTPKTPVIATKTDHSFNQTKNIS
nr:site-specific integrase [Desulfobacterales bacterium]